MAGKIKWQMKSVLRGYQVYSRTTRTEIVVRVENLGDTTKYAEWGMPKALGRYAAMDQAALQTKPEDIKE